MHNFKYALKTLFKNKMLIFWTFAFPIILGTLFKMAFSNIENSEKLDIINIAIVENEEFRDNEILKNAFDTLSDEANDERLFSIKFVEEEEAKQLLESDEISGYLLIEESPKIIISSNGINETIFKYVVEEILQSEEIVSNLAEQRIEEYINSNHPEETHNFNSIYAKIYEEVLEMQNGGVANIEDISSSNLSYTMIEFYTLIAMTCLYGGILGMATVNQNLANMSSNGKRVAISPTSKGKLILSSVLASYIVQLIGIAILFAYTIFVLKVDYGDNFPLIVLLTLVGALSGLSLGIFSASIFKTNENIKTGIVISFTMLGCFLSGMMGITMKYIVDKNVPIINMLNPASMITDGFYTLYYYDTLDRFYFNVISLLIFAFVMIAVSMFSLRRQKYDSI